MRSVERCGSLDEFAEARGEVAIPVGGNVELSVSQEAASDLTPLSSLAADDLQFLSIVCFRFDGTQLLNIRHLTGLLGLALWETDINEAAFSPLRGLVNLRWLDIGRTGITDDGLAFVREIAMLEELIVPETNIGDHGLRHVEKLTNLKRLVLAGTRVSDASFESLKGLVNLKLLSIMDTNISYPVYAQLKRALPECRVIYHEFAR